MQATIEIVDDVLQVFCINCKDFDPLIECDHCFFLGCRMLFRPPQGSISSLGETNFLRCPECGNDMEFDCRPLEGPYNFSGIPSERYPSPVSFAIQPGE